MIWLLHLGFDKRRRTRNPLLPSSTKIGTRSSALRKKVSLQLLMNEKGSPQFVSEVLPYKQV